MDKRLSAFVAHARTKQMDHATIRMLLLASGWREKDVMDALSHESLDMAVPEPPDRGGAREAFLHLVTFASLYATVISTIVLWFTFINRLFPDPAFERYPGYEGDLSAVRWSMAAIIVTFPLFLYLSRKLLMEMMEHAEKTWSIVRRWLTYLTLFIAAMALAGDVITLIFRLLEGEISIRFLLKVTVVFVVAGITFSYYILSLRTSPAEKS